MLIASPIAMASMILAVFIIGQDAGSEDLHMHSVLLHTIADAAAAAGVAVVGGVIYFTGRLYWLDTAVAMLIGLVIGFGALKLLRDVTKALLGNTTLKFDVDYWTTTSSNRANVGSVA